MSDQNPPSSSPGPDEPDDATRVDQTPVDEAPVDQEAPAEKQRRRGRLVTIVAGVLVLALVAGGLGAFFLLRTDSHSLSTPATAGKMKRDKAKETELSDPIAQAEKLIRSQSAGKGAQVTYVRSAVYNQADSDRGPEGALVFLGAKLKKKQVPADWVKDRFGKQAKQNGLTVKNVAAGEGGGKAVCASVDTPQKIAICAWATEDTIGELVPTVSGYDAKTLSVIMRDLRADVEKTE